MTTFGITLLLVAIIITGCISTAIAQTNRRIPCVRIEATVMAPAEKAFNYIVPISLPHIFKRYKKLPAVIKTDESEKWNKQGLSRTVYFEDGSTAKESLLTVIPDQSFSYKIENFTSQLRFLAKRVDGEWKFTDIGNGQTRIEWTYKIFPKHFIARGIINLFLIRDVRQLLENALMIIKADLDPI
ncbi:SRPBCC family protein [Pseudoflavitalea sp. G-6-1-2]|uniref:SRPBCC family protein n=1 Tax=Pseudoflavitalea sp. G-6-1-2 TaxID=2728841 RepID=UPI00146C8CC7|nr:SRPBCC family protein [Pseudoflavitalea sp. G-6-1-2]NML23997.1 SRPBCC family protein [Pseudoflavitalea sp. G-6-1-2]